VHFRKGRCRAVSMAVATLLFVSLSLEGCFAGGAASACAPGPVTLKSSPGLSIAKGVSNTTLPPSHDNDAGRARAPDTTPDADIDANQIHRICSEPK
jgi:hypothetical protein